VGRPVVNAGDGAHEHPTQALVDLYTLTRHRADVQGLRVTIVGDIESSRVARSSSWLLSSLGAQVTLVAPPTLLPFDVSSWSVETGDELDSALEKTDVLMLLRVQLERGSGARIPSLREYTARFGIDRRRAALLPEGALIMHPGPMNRGVEISPEAAALPNVLAREQVANGIAVRMAVLYLLLSGGGGGQDHPIAGLRPGMKPGRTDD
jgi:aspartate carbamoyltransferase catalytic subunit